MDFVFDEPRIVRNGGAFVRLDDKLRDCVVFLGPEQGDDIDLAGTGFLIKEGTGPDCVSYLVTAAHVARNLAGPFGIRFNTKAGTFRVLPVERADWIFHKDESVDVAAITFEPPSWAETFRFPTSSFASDFKIGTKNFGTGDFAYVVGLYRLLKHTRRNIPLVHTGHIAAMIKDHPIPVADPFIANVTHPTKGYLVESRAISGASGSPVFVRRSVKDRIRDPAAPDYQLKVWHPGTIWLLGMWQSSWPRKPDEELIEGVNLPKDVKVSVGVGITVPAPFIKEVLDCDAMKAQVAKAKAKRDAEDAATVDAAPPTKADNPRHKEDFRRLLNAAAQKRPQGGQT
jgi:hypothetical protein